MTATHVKFRGAPGSIARILTVDWKTMTVTAFDLDAGRVVHAACEICDFVVPVFGGGYRVEEIKL